MSHSCGLVCTAGLDGFFKQLNPAWTVQLGWSVIELLARPFVEFVHTDDRAATLAELSKLAAGADTIAFENRYMQRDGSYRWLHWNAKPVPGQPLVHATARDVTDQRRLEQEIVEISDREKDRLGRDLHDGLCQNLAGIAALCATLGAQLRPKSKPAAAAAEIARLLNDTIGEARRLARGLNPVGLNGSGLSGALDTFALNIGGLFGVSCTYRSNRPSFPLRPEVETHLYRIVQESVRNAITHGKAKRIEIALRIHSSTGTLTIRDDGAGIGSGTCLGNGMHTMNYRARLIGASLWVRPRIRGGTRVDCVFGVPSAPLEDERYG
ncbi:MAG: PAS domain S-box protein [Chthoniobacteraceae bacterium]